VAYAASQLEKAGYLVATYASTKGVHVDVVAYKPGVKPVRIGVECLVDAKKSIIEKAVKRLSPYFDRIIFVIPRPAFETDNENIIFWRCPITIKIASHGK